MSTLLNRGISSRMRSILQAAPVVVLEGGRATGKTSLGVALAADGFFVSTVDLAESTARAAARASVTSFVDNLRLPAIIDEAQLVPELLLAVKRRVDRERIPGSFLLTGSARLGRSQLGGSDPLAGRSMRMHLWPMTQGELAGSPVNLLERVLGGDLAHHGPPISHGELISRIARGGLPGIALLDPAIAAPIRRQLFAEYVEGVISHEQNRRVDRAELLRLFRFLGASTARILNVSSVANELAVSRDTVISRLATLESLFLLHGLAAHRPNEHKVLTAHPKQHVTDIGLAAWAARAEEDVAPHLLGALVETLVVNELITQASWMAAPPEMRHWRDNAKKTEVDVVAVASDGSSVAFEVKAGADVHADDLRGLRHYLSVVAEAKAGIVFYTGGLPLQLDDQIWALPITTLWSS